MAGKPVRFHPAADREYLSSLAWYAERSSAAAVDFESEFQLAISAIEQGPERWPVYISRYRRYVLHQFPFSIVYCVLHEETLVLAVAHAHRQPGYWRNRLKQ
jgi:plasmid stabilization system protein ParE